MLSENESFPPGEGPIGHYPIVNLPDTLIALGGEEQFPEFETHADFWDYVALNCIIKASLESLVTYSKFSLEKFCHILHLSPGMVAAMDPEDVFDIYVSEKLVYLALLFTVAQKYYEDPIYFVVWLYVPNQETENRMPADSLTTVEGINKLIDIIWGAVEGVYH